MTENPRGFIRLQNPENHDGVSSALLNKGVHVFDVDPAARQDLKNVVQAAGLVLHLRGHDLGFTDSEALFF